MEWQYNERGSLLGIVEKYWVLNAWCDILKKNTYVYDGNINIRFNGQNGGSLWQVKGVRFVGVRL